MRLNAQKTIVSNNIVKDSIKPDKLYWITSKTGAENIQEHLFLIHNLAEAYPNSGSLSKGLNKFYERVKGLKEPTQNTKVLISILVDIMYKNPRTYPITSAILSKLLTFIKEPERESILKSIYLKCDKIPNTGHIKLWLQRVTIKLDRQKEYEEDLCKKVNDSSIQIWNSDWLNKVLKTMISSTPIVSEDIIKEIDIVIDSKEVQLFHKINEYSAVVNGYRL